MGVIPSNISKNKTNGKKTKYYNEVDSNIWEVSFRALAEENFKVYDRISRVDCSSCGGVLNYSSAENV